MSDHTSTPTLNQPSRPAVILPFKNPTRKNARSQPCIFCGRTMNIQEFKGKNICLNCLTKIPTIFSCR